MRNLSRTTPRRGAFSLLELLVVIGLVATLIAILFPALGGVRRQTRSIVCLNNLRSHGQATHAYFSGHSDALLPLAHFLPNMPEGEYGLYGPLAHHLTVPLPRVREDGTCELLAPFHCPLDTTFAAEVGASYLYLAGYFMADYGLAETPNPDRQREITAMYEAYPDTPVVTDRERWHSGRKGQNALLLDGSAAPG
ncbi:MAG TPA: type II secretion system protein [Phycisphaerales bacterium]|nr:type II secretion system protein [Phycisphaerales bacterium]